jgi:hypothetical protein
VAFPAVNIFALDTDPAQAAAFQCDKHVVKMVLETAQLLSTVRLAHGLQAPYKSTHARHPSTLWVLESRENYRWLVAHLQALLAEYTRRYGKQHKVEGHLPIFLADEPALPDVGLTPFAQVMPEPYRREDDPIGAYRAYYNGEKAGFARWKLGNVPPWFG